MADRWICIPVALLLRLMEHSQAASDMHASEYSDHKKSNQADADVRAMEEIFERECPESVPLGGFIYA